MCGFLSADPGLASWFHFTLAIGRHIAHKDKIAIAEDAWPLLAAEAARLRPLPTDSGTALDVAGNGRYARKVVIACKGERALIAHRRPGRAGQVRSVGRHGPGGGVGAGVRNGA